MEYQILYRAAEGCRTIQLNVTCKSDLLACLRSWATEPLYRTVQVISVHEIRKTGAYQNGRRAKKLNVAKLIEEAKGKPLIEIL